MTFPDSELIPDPLSPSPDAMSRKEERDFSGEAKGFENDILGQKKEFRSLIFGVLVTVIFFFYSLAFLMGIGLFCEMLHSNKGEVHPTGIILFSVTCFAPTLLTILGLKYLLVHNDPKEKDEGEIKSLSDSLPNIKFLKELAEVFK